MSSFHVLISIKQFSETPIFLKGVDERIAWQRSWSSWNSLTLPSLPLFQLSTNEDLEIDCTYLASEEFVETLDETKAIEVAVSNINDKLGLLSLLTDRGFSIIGSYVIPETNQSFSLTDNIRRYHDNQIKLKAKTNAEIREETSKSKENDLIQGLRRFRFEAHETGKTLGESIEVIPQQYELTVDRNVKRKIEVVSKEELLNNWQIALQNLTDKNSTQNNAFSRSLNLWMNSRMNRDLNSRFLIDWAALDNLTPYIDNMGKEKTDKMASKINPISGIHSRLNDVLYKIYSSRNNIAHSKGPYIEKLEHLKKELILLEWIFKNYVRKELGISQVPEQAMTVTLNEILS